LFNLGIQVCPECYDAYQESGRTIVLPPDPVPVPYPLPEDYAAADNPISAVGFNVSDLSFNGSSLGANIGSLTQNGGLNAAFAIVGSTISSTTTAQFGVPVSAVEKRLEFCAALSVSNSSFGNTVGKNWNAQPSGINLVLPSTVAALSHIASGFVAYAPTDQPFLRTGATGYLFQGSSNGVNWTTISSGTTAGTKGETLSVTLSGTAAYGYHRLALQGDGISAIGVAGLAISISDAAPNDI
jgi:hypothetical protein